MTLRDWFAGQDLDITHADLAWAGGMVYSNEQIWEPNDSQNRKYQDFNHWWSHISQSERSDARAKARYHAADAMLAEADRAIGEEKDDEAD